MAISEDEIQKRVNVFLADTRGENTQRVARNIVNFLIKMWHNPISQNKRRVWKYGWTRSSMIFKEFSDEHPRTITRMLAKLTTDGVIEREKCDRVKGMPGNEPIFYRVPENYKPYLFATREELIGEIGRLGGQEEKDREDMIIARAVLKNKYGEDLDQIILESGIHENMEGKSLIFDGPGLTVTINVGEKEASPCTSLESF